MSESKAKIGERIECFVAELPAVKAALAARLPKGATISTVTRGTHAVLTVVAA